MAPHIPSIALPDSILRRITISRREVDSVIVGGIVVVGSCLVASSAGIPLDADSAWAMAVKYLGVSAPLFAAAMLFLVWVVGALTVEMTGLTDIRRRWHAVSAALFYLESAAPFVGLLECFISIVKALLAYSEAGASAAAQSILIANIAVALCASAVGCFVALCAHSLKAVLAHRMAQL